MARDLLCALTLSSGVNKVRKMVWMMVSVGVFLRCITLIIYLSSPFNVEILLLVVKFNRNKSFKKKKILSGARSMEKQWISEVRSNLL